MIQTKNLGEGETFYPIPEKFAGWHVLSEHAIGFEISVRYESNKYFAVLVSDGTLCVYNARPSLADHKFYFQESSCFAKSILEDLDIKRFKDLSLYELQNWFWDIGNATFKRGEQFIRHNIGDEYNEDVELHYENGTEEEFNHGLALGVVCYNLHEHYNSICIESETCQSKSGIVIECCIDKKGSYSNLKKYALCDDFVKYIDSLAQCITPVGQFLERTGATGDQRRDYCISTIGLQRETKELCAILAPREKLSLLTSGDLLKTFLAEHKKTT